MEMCYAAPWILVSLSLGLTSVATPSSAASACFQYKNGDRAVSCKVKGKFGPLITGGALLLAPAANYFWPHDRQSK